MVSLLTLAARLWREPGVAAKVKRDLPKSSGIRRSQAGFAEVNRDLPKSSGDGESQEWQVPRIAVHQRQHVPGSHSLAAMRQIPEGQGLGGVDQRSRLVENFGRDGRSASGL